MWKWIGSLFRPVNEILKTVDVSGNDRKKLENAFAEMQANLYTHAVELEKAKLDAHSKIVAAESQSPHWIAANWRPIASLSLVTLSTILCYQAGDSGSIIKLTTVLVGGHVGGRSLEKVAKAITLRK